MAANIQFIPIGGDKPIALNALDEKICEAVGEPVHPTRWCRGWFDYLGFLLAMGRGYDSVRERLVEDDATDQIPILDYLEANFEVRTWCD